MEVWKRWMREWVRVYGPLPQDYLVIDCETSGLSLNEDPVLQLGWCHVVNQEIVENGSTILNWTNHPDVDPAWLKRRLEWTRDKVTKRGKPYNWTMGKLATGEDPVDALSGFFHRVLSWLPSVIVGHNTIRFDSPMLSAHLRRFLHYSYELPAESIMDTGCFIKAAQMDWMPDPMEPPWKFASRVLHAPCRIKWSLDGYAVPVLGLDKKYNLDTSLAHTAAYDSRVAALVLETMRELAQV